VRPGLSRTVYFYHTITIYSVISLPKITVVDEVADVGLKCMPHIKVSVWFDLPQLQAALVSELEAELKGWRAEVGRSDNAEVLEAEAASLARR